MVHGPQKGAAPEMVVDLDAALSHLADLIRRDLEIDVTQLPGGGAAGGLGAGIVAVADVLLETGLPMGAGADGLGNRLDDAAP